MTTDLAEWFGARGWSPFAFQREVWDAYLAGESGLVHAATGTGKTLAAWLGPIAEWIDEGRPAAAPSQKRTRVSLRVLWITPLRALAADTAAALQAPLAELAPEWTVETRTSDTSAATRARQSKRLPTALLTTPESLTILLSRPESAELMSELRLVVVDEWHELMGTKRGVQTELALAHIRTLLPTVRIWGLSATLGNLHEALETLLGVRRHARARIVKGEEPKRITVEALLPPVIERFPWAGHLGRSMVPQVAAALEDVETAIVFTNTRSQTEQWYQALLEARPDWAGLVALHHGSLDRSTRDWVERALRDGRLRCVVATSSLDLGVDFSPVDRVLQIGSPKSVGRLVQRAGRSGHRPGAESRVTCVPTNVLELIDIAAARDAVDAGEVESRQPMERPLDVLVQHMVTVALGRGFRSEQLLAEVRGTRAFAALRDDEWQWAMDFVASGGGALTAYPEYARVVRQADGCYRVEQDAIARRHRLSIGTIVSDGQITVTYQRGKPLGTVDEDFVARLRPGDRFTLAGKSLEFLRVRDMQAWVRRASTSTGSVMPKWSGTRLPISGALAARLRCRLGEASRGVFRGPEMEALRPMLALQRKWSRLPTADELLIERVKTREGHHLYLFPFEGHLVHEGLAALIAHRLSRLAPISFSIAANDHGFSLLSADPAPLAEALASGLFRGDTLSDDLHAALNATEMARRQFREIARVAGLIFPGLPRSGKTARQLQASSGLFFDVFQRHDPANLLLEQAHREVLERQLESSRLAHTLARLARASVVITEPRRTTPFGFPLLVERTRDRVSSESLGDRVRRMQLTLERAAG